MPAKLDILNGTNQGESHTLKNAESIIGNRRSADIPIRDPWISWNHAKIYMQGTQFWIEDLGSSNGIYINREKVTRPQPLTENLMFMLGRTKVRFTTGQLAAGGPPPGPPSTGVPVSMPPAAAGAVQTFDIAQGEADQQITDLKNELRELRARFETANAAQTAKDQELWTARHNLEQAKRRILQLEEDLEAASQGAPPLNERAFPITFRQTLANRDQVIEDYKRRLAVAEGMSAGGADNVVQLQRTLEEQRATYEEKLSMGVRVIYQLEKDLMEKEQAGGGAADEAALAAKVKETEARILADFQRRWADAEQGWRRELDMARAQITELQQAGAGAADPAELERLKGEHAAVGAKLLAAEQALAEAQARATAAEQQLATSAGGAAETAALQEKLNDAEQQVTNLQAQIENGTAALDETRSQVAELQAATQALQAQLAEKDQALAAAQADSGSADALAAAQAEAAQLGEQKASLEGQLADLQDKVAGLESDLEAARSAAGDSEEVEKLREELAEVAGNLKSVTREKTQLTEELGTLEEELEKARSKDSEVKIEEYNELVGELEDSIKLVRRLKNEKAEFEKELIRLEEELDAKESGGGDPAELERLRKQNADLEGEMHALEDELEKKDKQLKAANKEIDALEAELAELEGD